MKEMKCPGSPLFVRRRPWLLSGIMEGNGPPGRLPSARLVPSPQHQGPFLQLEASLSWRERPGAKLFYEASPILCQRLATGEDSPLRQHGALVLPAAREFW